MNSRRGALQKYYFNGLYSFTLLQVAFLEPKSIKCRDMLPDYTIHVHSLIQWASCQLPKINAVTEVEKLLEW